MPQKQVAVEIWGEESAIAIWVGVQVDVRFGLSCLEAEGRDVWRGS